MIKTWRERIALSNGQWPDDECMKAEIDELREAFANLHSDYDIIEIDRDELKAKLAEKTESEKKWIALHGAVCDLHDKAKAKLAALEAQKIPAAIAAALSNCENLAIASGAHEAYRIVGQAFNKLRATIAAGAAPIQLTDDQLYQIADRCTPNTETGSLNYKMFAREVLAAAGAAPVQQEPVAYFIYSSPTYQQVDPVHKNDDDVFPLYRAAPAKEQT